MGFPLSPEEQAKVDAHWGSNPGNSSMANAPLASVNPADFYGPPMVEIGAAYDIGPTPVPPLPPAVAAYFAAGPSSEDQPYRAGAEAAGPPPVPTDDKLPPPLPQRSDDSLDRTAGTQLGVSPPKPQPAATAPVAHTGIPGGRDPFGVDAARKGIRGTYDREAEGLQAGADTDKARADLLAQGGLELAQQKAQQAADQAAEAKLAGDHFRAYQEETQRQLDDVRAQKIDPTRSYADGGAKAMAIFGGLLGGMYQGRNKMASNPFIDDMNKNIDRDIAVQEKNIANQRASVSERRSLLGDMRATYKDETLARLQAKNLYWESAKENLMAQAATYDSPKVQALADQGIAAINREQGKLDLVGAQEKAAQARAGAAAKLAAQERARKAALEDREMAVKEGKLLVDAAEVDQKGQGKSAELASRFVSTGRDQEGNPTGYLERNTEGAKERENTRIAAASLMTKIDDAIKIRGDEGALGRTINRNNPDQWLQLYKPEWQTKIQSLKAEMITDWGHAKKLGVLSTSDRELADAAIGDLESRGDRGDVSLNQLKATLQRALEAEDRAASGPRGTKYIDPRTGREHVVLTGQYNTQTNPKVVQHYGLDGKPLNGR